MSRNKFSSADARLAGSMIVSAACLALLSGCGPDSKPVTSAAGAVDPLAAQQAVAAPCAEPAGMNLPGPPQPVNQVEFGLSPKARRAHKSGCAGVRFVMAADGTVSQPVLVVEDPAGYGFGKATLDGIVEFKFDPARVHAGPYYYQNVIIQTESDERPRRPDVQ